MSRMFSARICIHRAPPMRRFTLSLLASTVLATAGGQGASAADLPLVRKAPPIPVAAYSWSGFYVGGHIGAGWSRNSIDSTDHPDFCGIDGFTSFTFDASGTCKGGSHIGLGFIGGGQ